MAITNERAADATRERPEQYKDGIDTFERAEANMSFEEVIACMRFNIDKYNWRKKDKTVMTLKK